METTVKTAEFTLLAANYDEMFTGFLKVVAELYPETSDPQTLQHYKSTVKSEIMWAKQHLKKQDRIVWYLRWVRLMLLKDITRNDPASEAKYLKPELDRLSKLVGSDVTGYRVLRITYASEIQRLHQNLDHYLSLPIPDIQNTVFDKQAPDSLFQAFKNAETAWQERSKGALVPHEGDEIVLQFPDGWAWWKLGRGYCPEEAKAMGHCGNVNGQYNTDERILSLRKPIQFGNEKRWEPFLTFILDGQGFLGEMKGRANERPAQRYYPYIEALLGRSDIVKGVKGGGYLPSHNFHLDDLDYNTQTELKKKNPGLKTCRERLRELGGKPDQALINKISKSDKVEGYYSAADNGWIVEEWSSPAKFITENVGGDMLEAYQLFQGENPPYEGDYLTNQAIRQTLQRLPIDDIVLIDQWLTSQNAGSPAANSGRRAKHRETLIHHLFSGGYRAQGQQDERLRQTLEAAKVKLWDIYKAGITDGMRADLGEQIKKTLEEAWNSSKGTQLTFNKDDFWGGTVLEIMPLNVAAAAADGENEESDEEDEGWNDYEEQGFDIDWHYNDPFDLAYQKNLDKFKTKIKRLKPEDKKKVEQLDQEFHHGDRQPFIQWAEKVVPGAFKEAAGKGWDINTAHRACLAEFGQGMMFPVPTEKERIRPLTDEEIRTMQWEKERQQNQKSKKQHASLLLQKNASFELIAANYEEMFKNILPLAEGDKVRDYKATVDQEIAWAKKTLKKQDRIVWWLRWFRLGILNDLYSKAANAEAEAEYKFLQLNKQKEHWQGQHDHYVNKGMTPPKEWATMPQDLATELSQLQQNHGTYKQKEETIKKALDAETNSLSKRTGQDVHGGNSLSWFARNHQEMEHFLSLPTPGIQNVVWDKQTPLDLQQTFQRAEKEWQDRTKGLLRPQTEPTIQNADRTNYMSVEVGELEEELEKLQTSPIKRQWVKYDEEGDVIASSMTQKEGYTQISQEQAAKDRAEEIAELEQQISEKQEAIDRIANEVDTVFIQFQDGWAWWKLSRAYCSEEGKAMGHCGNVTGQDKTDQRILSLRQPKKVGNEQYWEPHLTFILEPNGFLGEMKGKANQKPAPQYHKYIITLLEDPRIKGLKGGGYAPERNFSFKDLTPEQQNEVLAKNPNMMGCTVMLQKSGVTPELIQKVEALLGFDKAGDNPTPYRNPIDPKYGKGIAGWITETWKSVDDLVEDKGNDPAKWVAKQMSGDGDYFDYADHVSWSTAFDNMDKKQEDILRKFIEVEHPDVVEQWIDQEKENGEAVPDFADADLQDLISEYSLDEVEQSLWRCLETGMRYGAEEEMYNALSKAVSNFEFEETGEQILLPKYEHEGKEGITWDSPVHAYLSVEQAAALADRGEPFQYYIDEELRSEAKIDVQEPYYGWSGWSDSGFNEEFMSEFGHPYTQAEQEKKQQEMEAEAKVRPDLIPVKENGKITGWRHNPEYKGPELAPGGYVLPDASKWKVVVEKDNGDQRDVRVLDEKGNMILLKSGTRDTDQEILRQARLQKAQMDQIRPSDQKKKKSPAKKKSPNKKKKKQRASRTAAVPDWHQGKSGELLKRLKSLPYAEDIKVFGSVARGKEQPGDIDLFIDLRGQGKHPAWKDLMELAKEFHGGFDPFIIADDGEKDGKPIYKVWGRNDGATGWVPARHADAMLESMEREGMPLLDVLPFRTAAKVKKEQPVIEAHREGPIMHLDWMHIPENMRGKGLGRSVYEAWEERLPKDITTVRLFAADAGDGPAAGFWEKMGFEYVYDRETYDYELDNQMWKGVNGNPTPSSIDPYEGEDE